MDVSKRMAEYPPGFFDAQNAKAERTRRAEADVDRRLRQAREAKIERSTVNVSLQPAALLGTAAAVIESLLANDGDIVSRRTAQDFLLDYYRYIKEGEES